ncbi:unnamed protein product [Urochloa humidicola]
MLMTAVAVHMDSAAHVQGPSYSSTSPPPPWFTAYDDFTASAPSPQTPAIAAPPQSQLRPTGRRVTKRRPRPSRKLPTTYIAADPASFRRMVHQVTGADDLPIHPAPPEILCRPAPSRAAPAGAMMLPTLDTSAFLLGAPSSVEATSAAAPAVQDPAEAGGAAGLGPALGACNFNGSSCGGAFFPTLDSWDPLV